MNAALQALDRLGSQRWFADAVVLGLCGAVLLTAMVMSPSPDAVGLFGVDMPVVCGMRRLTGLPCPGCGLTRSFVFLGHGRLVEAFQMNWFGPPLFVAVLSQVPWRLYRIARGRSGGVAP